MKILLCMIVTVLLTISGISIGYCENNPSGNCGIVYGDNHSFMICAAPGWILDNKSGVQQGLHAVFYEVGETWQNSPAVMYANWANKSDEIKDIDGLVAYDINKFKENGSPNIQVKKVRQVITEEGAKGEIWEYNADRWGNFEWVCLFEEEEGIAMLVLTSRTKADFESAQEAFLKIAESYVFMTSKIMR